MYSSLSARFEERRWESYRLDLVQTHGRLTYVCTIDGVDAQAGRKVPAQTTDKLSTGVGNPTGKDWEHDRPDHFLLGFGGYNNKVWTGTVSIIH